MVSTLALLTFSFISAVIAAVNEGYVFVHFTNERQALYLSASRDNNALAFDRVNGGNPILTSTQGTGGLRDPHILTSHNGSKFWILATDLDDSRGYDTRFGSRYIEIWESTDMVNWSEQRHTLVAPTTAGMAWAPEAHYVEGLDVYQVYWASTIYAEDDTNHEGDSYLRTLQATTTDFISFSEASVWVDYGVSAVDCTVYQDGSTYHRFDKIDPNSGLTNCVDIIQQKNSDLPATSNWEKVTDCIGKNAGLPNSWSMEGPSVIHTNEGDVSGDMFVLYADDIGDDGNRDYVPLVTANISAPNWQRPNSWTIPPSTRHGSVMPVTAETLQRVKSHYGV